MKKKSQPIKNLIALALFGVLILTTSCKKSNQNIDEPITEKTSSIDTAMTTEEDIAEIPTSENIETSTSENMDYDKVLDDYDQYVTEYVKFYKKAMKGDNSAMSEYPIIMEKATELQKSMEEAQGNNELSIEQSRRMSEIQNKMLKAMQQ
jgi:hypothetical protein